MDPKSVSCDEGKSTAHAAIDARSPTRRHGPADAQRWRDHCEQEERSKEESAAQSFELEVYRYIRKLGLGLKLTATPPARCSAFGRHKPSSDTLTCILDYG